MPTPALPEDSVERLRVHIATLYHGSLGARLLERLGGAAGVLRAGPATLRAFPGVTPAVLAQLFSRDSERLAREECRRAEREGIRLLFHDRPDFPASLRGLDGMPLVLWLLGSTEALRAGGDGTVAAPQSAGPQPTVGIVGSRRPSPYGAAQARRFSSALASGGFVVVSGLASGIDGEAHRACLDSGGLTVAVTGSGLGRVYPREHSGLVRRIAGEGRGAVVTEFPYDTPPKSFHFPLRNRILSGLSDAILVVEAGDKSGSLITARHALDQGKPIYVVPGRIGSDAMGGLRLLYDGAAPALEPDDVLPDRPRRGSGRDGVMEARLCALDGPFAEALETMFREEDAWHPDDIVERLAAPASQVLAELSRLEMEGGLERSAAGSYTRKG